MFCSNCGEKLPDDAEFCPECGDPVDDSERAPTDEPQAEEVAAAPPPPVTPAEEAEPSRDKPKKARSGTWCLVSCLGLLLLLGAIVIIGVAVRPGGDTQTDGAAATGEAGGASDAPLPFSDEAETPSTDGAEAADETIVSDFDPSAVDESLLPVFYGFLKALGDDDPYAMEKWFAPELQDRWDASAYERSTDLEHVVFVFISRTTTDGVESFVISEVMDEKSTGRRGKTDWLIKFGRVDGEWRVLDIPRLNEE